MLFLVSVAGDFLDDRGAEALRDERHRIYRRHPAVLVDQFGEVDLVLGWRFLVDRRRRLTLVAARRSVEAVVRDGLEAHLTAEATGERGADVVGFLLEARDRDVVVRARHPEGDHALV